MGKRGDVLHLTTEETGRRYLDLHFPDGFGSAEPLTITVTRQDFPVVVEIGQSERTLPTLVNARLRIEPDGTFTLVDCDYPEGFEPEPRAIAEMLADELPYSTNRFI